MDELISFGIDCMIVRTQFLPNKHANAIVNIDTGKLNGDTLYDKNVIFGRINMKIMNLNKQNTHEMENSGP